MISSRHRFRMARRLSNSSHCQIHSQQLISVDPGMFVRPEAKSYLWHGTLTHWLSRWSSMVRSAPPDSCPTGCCLRNSLLLAQARSQRLDWLIVRLVSLYYIVESPHE